MTLENVQILSSKPYINSYACRLTEQILGAEISTSEKFQFHNNLKALKKTSSILSSLVSI